MIFVKAFAWGRSVFFATAVLAMALLLLRVDLLFARWHTNSGMLALRPALVKYVAGWEVVESLQATSAIRLAETTAPENPFVARGLGYLSLLAGDEQGAATYWQRSTIPASYVYASLAKNAYDQERLRLAEDWYRQAVANGHSASVNMLADLIIEQQGGCVLATSVWEKALAEFPKDTNRALWWERGAECFRDEKRWGEAIRWGESAVREFPDSSVLLTGLSQAIYHGDGASARALQLIEKSIELNPTAAWSYAFGAEILASEGRFDDAYRWYDTALQFEDREEWRVSQANMLRAQGRLSDALAKYVEVVVAHPSFPTVYYQMAWAYMLNGDREEALASIEQALALRKDQALYFERAGQIYEWAGEAPLAADYFEQALLLNPNSAIARRGLVRLEEEQEALSK